MNPLPAQSSRLYSWTPVNPAIVNGFPVYEPGQEGAFISISGARADGSPATRVDPNLTNGYSRQALVFVGARSRRAGARAAGSSGTACGEAGRRSTRTSPTARSTCR